MFGRKSAQAYWLKNLRIREVSLVDSPASPGANVILAKSRDDASPQDAADADFAAGGGPAGSPAISEKAQKRWRKQVKKAFRSEVQKMVRVGDPVANHLVADAFGLSNASGQSDQKSRERVVKAAGDALNQIAFAERLAHPELSTFQAFAKAAREHPDIYASSRGLAKDANDGTGLAFNGALDDNNTALRQRSASDIDAVQEGGRSALATLNFAGDEADDMSADDANQFILDTAAECKRQHAGWSMTQCLHYAASAHPGVYHRSRGAMSRG